MDARWQGPAAWRRRAGRVVAGRVLAWTVTTVTMAVLGATPTVAATVVPPGALMPVVVQGASGAAAAEVTRLGGVVDRRLTVLDGVRARVPLGGIATLARVDGVRAVSPDGPLAPGP